MMKQAMNDLALLLWLLVAGLLISAASNSRAQETSTQQFPQTTVLQQGGTAKSDQRLTTTETLTGCLEKMIDMDDYRLIGPHSDEWILKSDAVDLSAYRSRWVRVTVLTSPYNEGPLLVVAVEITQGTCTRK